MPSYTAVVSVSHLKSQHCMVASYQTYKHLTLSFSPSFKKEKLMFYINTRTNLSLPWPYISPSLGHSFHPTAMVLHGNDRYWLLSGCFKKKKTQTSCLQEMCNTTFFVLPAWFHPKIFLAIKNVLGKHISPQTGLRMADQNLCFSWKKSAGLLCQHKPFT